MRSSRLLPASLSLLILSACVGAGVPQGSPAVIISDAWMRLAPGGEGASVYLRLQSRRDLSDALVGASMPAAEAIEIHSMKVEDGMMRMRHLDRVELKSGEEILFEPGGYHLMVVGLEPGVEPGTEVELTLEMQSGPIDVWIPVRVTAGDGG